MEANKIMVVVLVLLVAFAAVQAYQVMSLKKEVKSISSVTGSTTAQNGAIDMAGWTENEKMMYEHHGTLPARLQGGNVQTAPASSGMVGGC